MNKNVRSESPTFIVTDPDSDIETDALPSAPRPRGSPIPGPPKPHIVEDEEPSSNGQIPGKTSTRSQPKSGKVPPGKAFMYYYRNLTLLYHFQGNS